MDVSNDALLRSRSDPAQRSEQPASNHRPMKHDEDSQAKAENPITPTLKELTDLALQFLSASSNETLLLVLACLMGATYFIFGRLGLIIIGVAIGVTLHASWEGAGNLPPESQQGFSRRQLSLHISSRLLDWQNNKGPEQGANHINHEGHVIEDNSGPELDPSIFGPATASALQSLVDAVVRDYVNYWYEPILPSESSFPISCRRILVGFITSISSHLRRKRTADAFLEFLTNSTSTAIVFLNELSTAFEAAGPTVTTEDAILRYLESDPESSLSNLLANQQQHKKLIMISDDILSRFLDHDAYSCAPLRNLLREILAGVVFESTIVSMSKPEFINGWITYLFSEGESEIMNAIDAGVEGARTHGVTATSTKPASVSGPDIIADPGPVPKVPTRTVSKIDQATEEAMLEAKRLSDMIAAQTPERGAEETMQNDVHEGKLATSDSAITNADTEGMIGMKPSAKAGSAGDAHEAGPPEGGGSLPSLPLHSPETPPTTLPPESLNTPSAFTLYRASITVDDSVDSGDKTTLRVKPSSSYLLQIEPQSGRSSGWMVFRKYMDFESIHETLGTISRLNELRFGDSHPIVPPWRGQTRQALARALERYLQDALHLEPLAESVTMRRFLEKDGAFGAELANPSSKPGFVFSGQTAFGNVGKGVLDVLASAPRGVSGGGKAVFEGVTGVFGGTSKKAPSTPGTDNESRAGGDLLRNELLLRADSPEDDEDLRPSCDATDGALPSQTRASDDTPNLPGSTEATSLTGSSDTPLRTPGSEENPTGEATGRASTTPTSIARGSMVVNSINLSGEKDSNIVSLTEDRRSTEAPAGRKHQNNPITEDETRLAVELIFAVINELYSLSSAWNIRRTLLNAAKTYILRPGNPSLETIRNLLQESMIDSHSSDEAVGIYLAKLRENSLPTAEELSSWPAPISEPEKERQREAARRVLVQKGLPQTITSVMGAVASREALGKVFDSLQIELVARGFVFSVLLQALRAVAL
ncbi:PX domain protein [Aspergillus lucknowensis]|uniref:PXA domain-containing protein n=1 Tax=Aspergillus lucknowensis TaxID=176173 RepID=A0ABR4L8Z3_9EURO